MLFDTILREVRFVTEVLCPQKYVKNFLLRAANSPQVACKIQHSLDLLVIQDSCKFSVCQSFDEFAVCQSFNQFDSSAAQEKKDGCSEVATKKENYQTRKPTKRKNLTKEDIFSIVQVIFMSLRGILRIGSPIETHHFGFWPF